MSRISLVLADDHAVVRDGLRMILERDFQVLGVVGDGRALLQEAERLQPDVVLLDISMPLLNGIDATRKLRRSLPRTRVVVLTMHDDAGYVTEALEAGADGYVLKNAPMEEVAAAIRAVVSGSRYVSPRVAQDMPLIPARPTGIRTRRNALLTPRQREVLQLLAEGKRTKEIAGLLFVSSRTVEFHKYKMMEELGMGSTAELVRYAVKHRIVAV